MIKSPVIFVSCGKVQKEYIPLLILLVLSLSAGAVVYFYPIFPKKPGLPLACLVSLSCFIVSGFLWSLFLTIKTWIHSLRMKYTKSKPTSERLEWSAFMEYLKNNIAFTNLGNSTEVEVVLPPQFAIANFPAKMEWKSFCEAIQNNAKFVVFPYCMSCIFVTAKLKSPVYFILPGQNTFMKSIRYTLMSFLLGWWGIPWGPIYTVSSIMTNLSGGEEITKTMLKELQLPEFNK